LRERAKEYSDLYTKTKLAEKFRKKNQIL